MGKLQLKDVCLVAADTYNYGGAVASLKKCMEQCDFGQVIYFTNIPLRLEGITVIQIDELKGKDGYSHFLLKEAYKYISNDFVLVVQHDSWILDTEQFDEKLYDVDYAGALWLENDGLANGNGGFSWRSYKLMEAVGKDDLINATTPEDVALCRVYRRYLEKNHGLIWANDDMCEQFSFELRCPVKPTFGFHNYFHRPYQKTVVIKRMAAMGDCVMVEPVMRYFNDKGYRVVLDTLPQFHLLFINHFFKVHKLQEIDQRLLATAKFVNLDMAYESQPTQLHLKSYFEYAGVGEEDYLPYLKTPQLSVGFPLVKETKIFEKYAVLHVDNRPQGGRNIYDVHWESLVDFLKGFGYTVIQLGKDDTAVIPNAIRMNCTNENFLCYVTGGADLFVGIDSGISNIAAAFNVPCVIMFGSVDPKVIHPESINKVFVHNHSGKGVCNKPFCWSSVIGCEGVKCYIDENRPPCASFVTTQIMTAINDIHEQQNAIKI